MIDTTVDLAGKYATYARVKRNYCYMLTGIDKPICIKTELRWKK